MTDPTRMSAAATALRIGAEVAAADIGTELAAILAVQAAVALALEAFGLEAVAVMLEVQAQELKAGDRG